MKITSNSNIELFDKSINSECPHCGKSTNLILISPPNFKALQRFRPKHTGMAFQCASCAEPIFLKFEISRYTESQVGFFENFTLIERPSIEFEFQYIPESVVNDFKEALNCYSNFSYNAFAAMCRRTVQSTASEIGAKGKSKVQNQLEEMKEMAEIDDETFDILKQIIIDGHDGAHPHLPNLSAERAEILLELIKDVMYQIFVRKGKLKKAVELRSQQIATDK
ncbi:hypothetical protein LCGC14_1793390 [marine sediment metagenome]|uniref:DUF4145 domain-containing protein n=2 Tax=root TaxID=1 RepID=A0A831QRL4_9FLAO|nr:DUF4145 domain-containing protein [Pricia antarctica]